MSILSTSPPLKLPRAVSPPSQRLGGKEKRGRKDTRNLIALGLSSNASLPVGIRVLQFADGWRKRKRKREGKNEKRGFRNCPQGANGVEPGQPCEIVFTYLPELWYARHKKKEKEGGREGRLRHYNNSSY